MPLGFDPVHPGGMDENSPAFQRWERGFVVSSPEGTAEWVRYRTSLWDLSPRASTPSVETLVITHIFSVLESTKLICNWLRGGLGG